MNPDFSSQRVYVAGHRGMVGGALVRALRGAGCKDVVLATREELDLRDQAGTRDFVKRNQPDVVVVAAAKVGGIFANDSFPAEFLYDNLQIASNLVHASFEADVPRLLFLGSSCVYPKHADQPILESSLLSGPLEPTNEAYAIAKIAGIKLCEFYRKQYGVLFHSAMPCNLYGLGDNYHPDHSHVIPGLIRRFHEAKMSGQDEVVAWGSGTPLREFLFSEDLAEACLHLLSLEEPPSLVNVGSGKEVSISQLTELVAKTIGYEGKIVRDLTKPDGTPRKLMDSSTMRATGWEPGIELEEGLRIAYENFLENSSALRS